jgi:hypothetical protein
VIDPKLIKFISSLILLLFNHQNPQWGLDALSYSDLDFAGDVDDRKFTSGYVFTLARGAISWKSSNHHNIVHDSIQRPLKIYCDNEPTIFYAHNDKSSGAAKHIDIKFYVVKEKIQDHTISLEHVRRKEMLADPITKGFPPNVFREHLAGMGLRESL